MKLIETTPTQILEYLKRTIFREVPIGLWDCDLWCYKNIKLSGSSDGVSNYAKHYILNMDSNAVGICTVSHQSMYIQIYAHGFYDLSICEVIGKLYRKYKVPIRVSTVDEKLGIKIAEYFHCSLQSDYSRFYLETSKITCNNSALIDNDKIMNIKPINCCRAEIILTAQYDTNLTELTPKILRQCTAELSTQVSNYDIYTWAIPVEETIQIELAQELEFKKIYTEYFCDITNE